MTAGGRLMGPLIRSLRWRYTVLRWQIIGLQYRFACWRLRRTLARLNDALAQMQQAGECRKRSFADEDLASK